MQTELALTDMVIRLLAAVALAAVIGLERQLKNRPAGLRTHMLVALGSAAFLLVGLEILFATAEGDPSARIDPTRIVEGVIGGIGFLGAGSIIQSRGSVHGITTGAAIWIAGAIGVACATGNLILAGLVTLIALIIVLVMGVLEREVAEVHQPEKDKDSHAS
ncbi:MAG: MgtC/SapB family protein [Algiphilus sp.]